MNDSDKRLTAAGSRSGLAFLLALGLLGLPLLFVGACGGETKDSGSQDLGLEDDEDENTGSGSSGASESESSSGASSDEPAELPDPSTYGTISGVVNYRGTPPKEHQPQVLNLSGTPACAKHHSGEVLTENYLIKDGKLQNAVVYIRRGLHKELEFETPTEAIQFDQIGCVFKPHVVAMRVGQPLDVNNGDDEAHNVRTIATKNTGFNINMPPNDPGRDPFVFKRTEIIKVVCDVHPWMNAQIAIFDHPYFMVTGEDGRFTLENVPPGSYTVTAWHEKLGRVDQKVTLEANGEATTEFEFPES